MADKLQNKSPTFTVQWLIINESISSIKLYFSVWRVTLHIEQLFSDWWIIVYLTPEGRRLNAVVRGGASTGPTSDSGISFETQQSLRSEVTEVAA